MKYILVLFDFIIGALFFGGMVYSYIMGVKHGKAISKGEIPVLNPIIKIKEYKEKVKLAAVSEEEKKKADDAQEGWYGENGIMNYDPYYKGKEGE